MPSHVYNEQSKNYTIKYKKEHYDRININVRKEEKAYYEAVAEIAQKPLRIFMQEAINEKIERDHLR